MKEQAIMMNFILIMFLLSTSKAIEIFNITQPVPKIECSNNEPKLLIRIGGCIFKTNKNNSVICTGLQCQDFSAPRTIKTDVLTIKTTRIKELKRDDFSYLTNLHMLEIQFNINLVKIEAGTFRNMNQLSSLSISNNINLKYLDEDVFEGLMNLTELYMIKNGFFKLYDITKTLSLKYVPSLLKLHLNDNVFKSVSNSDFGPMEGTPLQELQMVLCQIEYIQPTSLNSLKKLQTLFLGQNQFNETIIENVINETIKNNIPLEALSLSDAGFRRSPPMILLKLVAQTRISQFSLSRNSFDNLYNYSFPAMPNITALDLSSCLLLDIAPGTFDAMINLDTLLLHDNRLPSVSSGFTLKQLKNLDISGNSGNQISRSYFRVDDYVFMEMDQLVELELSNNLLTQVTGSTFAGLINLEYLGLKNATLFIIDDGAFSQLKKLKYLNLENNQYTYPLNGKIFTGLDALETLLLGGCSIEFLDPKQKPFQFLPNLTYLGLQKNSLYTVSPSVFPPLKNLKNLDLSYNRMIEWGDSLLSTIRLTALDLSQNKIKTLTKTMLLDFEDLDVISLEGNPFTCDCSLYTVLTWMETHNNSLTTVLKTDSSVKCVNPDEWSQKPLLDYLEHLNKHLDMCQISTAVDQKVVISVGSSLFILIIVLIVLGFIYRSHVRHWSLLTRMALRRYLQRNKKQDDSVYKYDAFVSYSNEDQDFVLNLVCMLEKNEPYFRLCVYERDFQIGCAISESVLQSVASSRKTLLIISDSFAKSQWCRWEAKLAEHHHLFFEDGNIKGSQGTLLMILLGDVNQANITPTLKYLLKTRIYLQWTSKPEEQRVFWSKLRKKLSSPNNVSYERMTISET